jgi:hypothetical protein
VVGGPEAAADTKKIASAVLAELVKEGMDPAKDRIVLSVSAQQEDGKGPTGKPLPRPFGSAVYDYNTDPTGISSISTAMTPIPAAKSRCATMAVEGCPAELISGIEGASSRCGRSC